MLTPPLAPPTSPWTQRPLHSCPKSSLEPGRNLTLPPIFQHRILKFSRFYPHLDHFHLEEGEIDKSSALDMLQWQRRCLAISYNTYVKPSCSITNGSKPKDTLCSHLRSILQSHRNLFFLFFDSLLGNKTIYQKIICLLYAYFPLIHAQMQYYFRLHIKTFPVSYLFSPSDVSL